MSKGDERLELVTVRLPAAFLARLRAEVEASGTTLSDVLRSHFDDQAVRPLNMPRPRKRPTLNAPKRADSRFLAALWLVYRAVERFNAYLTDGKENADALSVSRIKVELHAVRCILDERRQSEREPLCT